MLCGVAVLSRGAISLSAKPEELLSFLLLLTDILMLLERLSTFSPVVYHRISCAFRLS